MHYLMYRITNTINGKSYIGCHKTEDKNDEYSAGPNLGDYYGSVMPK